MRKVFIAGLILALMMVVVPAMAGTTTSQTGTTLSATVTANPPECPWTITKSVDHGRWDLVEGWQADPVYTVTWTKGEIPATGVISGEVCVTNGGAYPTDTLTINVFVTQPPTTTVIGSSAVDVSAKQVLAAGESYCYPYTVTVPINTGSYKVTAKVTILNHAGWVPGGKNCPGPNSCPFGPSPSSPSFKLVCFFNPITIRDTNGGSWGPTSSSGSATYDKLFSCADAGVHVNTATIYYSDGSAGPSDDARVEIACTSAAGLAKDASQSFDWTITKSADQPVDDFVPLGIGDHISAHYIVTVDATPSDVTGQITITNGNPKDDETATVVTDTVEGCGAVELTDCEGQTVPFGGSLVCDYAIAPCEVPTPGTNTVYVTVSYPTYTLTWNSNLQEFDFTPLGDGTLSTDKTVDVEQTDECADVTDTYAAGPQNAEVCYPNVPQTFEYDRQIGPYAECGDYTVDNTATYITNDNGKTDSASVSIPVKVTGCEPLCTYTQGAYGADPHGENPATMLQDTYVTVFPTGLKIGTTNYDSWTGDLDPGLAGLRMFLGGAGQSSQITGTFENPTANDLDHGGTLASQAATLTINIKLSDSQVLPAGFGGLYYCNDDACLTGSTVNDILDATNQVLGTGLMPSSCAFEDFEPLVTNLNEAFDNCAASDFANLYLKTSSCS